MKHILALYLLLSNTRPWEQWDQPQVAEHIDAYWLAAPSELEHRKRLAALVQEFLLPNERLLEIGCGTGLVYNQLVPSILPNDAYTGVDISDSMLAIAHQRFPSAPFFKGDLYNLSFADNSFHIAAAFEVFGHISTIEEPIQEMFRTASRLVIFTVWTAPHTIQGEEYIGNTRFIRTTFSPQDIIQAINRALNKPHTIRTHPLSPQVTAFIIYKL